MKRQWIWNKDRTTPTADQAAEAICEMVLAVRDEDEASAKMHRKRIAGVLQHREDSARERFNRLLILGIIMTVAFVTAGWFVVGGIATRVQTNTGRIEAQADLNTELIEANRELLCAISRLVSYVPALQFEGEPLENFLGWLAARRAMLSIVEEGTCNPHTETLLVRRVRLDTLLLRQLRSGE